MRYVMGRVLSTLLFGLLLFASAGRVDLERTWLYLSVVLIGELLTAAILAVANPGILERRGSLAEDAKTYDRVFVALFLALVLLTPIVAGLDVGRHGEDRIPLAGMYLGLAAMLPSYLLGAWAMAVNEHFELLMRIQNDRGHRVVSSGPYRFVRHPGYLAAIAGSLATPPILGSLWAFAPALAGTLLLALRTALEDRTLREELPGYREYAAHTGHRLLPGIW